MTDEFEGLPLVDEDPDEHSCHVHPLGSRERVRYWCGHYCTDEVCRRYKAVWMIVHPRHVVMHLLGRFPNGRKR